MEPTSSNVSAKIISALIIGLIVGFVAGAFWQERRLSAPASDEVASVEEAETEEEGTTTASKTAGADKSKDTKADVSGQGAAVVKAVTDTAGGLVLSAKVSAEDQSAGDTVSVSVTSVSEPVWIAVREDKDGKLGNILGAHKSFGDEQATVLLLRPTVANMTYHVVMYKDVGGADFNHKEDILLEKGQVTFKAK